MFEIQIPEALKWALGQAAVVAWYIFNEMRRVKKEVDSKVDAKVDKLEFEKERELRDADIEKIRAEHNRAIERLERQSDEKINRRFDQLAETIRNTEKHLSEKLEMVISMINTSKRE